MKEDLGYVMSVLREAGKASAMIEESVEKQHTLADTSAREEDISPLPIKEEGNNETVSSGILDMYDRSKEQYPDAMALIRVGDEYKAYNQDAERLHEVLGGMRKESGVGKRRHAGHDSLVPSRRSGYASP